MMDWNGHMTGGGWVASILAMIIMLALVVGAIVWITRLFSERPSTSGAQSTSALEILDARLASGEIKTEQYEQLRQTLDARPDRGAGPRLTHAADAKG